MKTKVSLKNKTYRLTNNRSGEAFLLKTGRDNRLLVFDKDLRTNRAIRHCPSERSVFIDEQSTLAYVEPVIFERGYKDVKMQDQITQKFLDIHPDNVANGGSWFEEVDDEKQAVESVEREELVLDLKYAIRSKAKEKDSLEAMRATVSVILGSIDEAEKMQKEQLKATLYSVAENNPQYFTDDFNNISIFDDGDSYRKYITLKALKEGIIKRTNNNKSMIWRNEKTIICTAPSSIDLVDFFSDFLTSDEGILVCEEILKRM